MCKIFRFTNFILITCEHEEIQVSPDLLPSSVPKGWSGNFPNFKIGTSYFPLIMVLTSILYVKSPVIGCKYFFIARKAQFYQKSPECDATVRKIP